MAVLGGRREGRHRFFVQRRVEEEAGGRGAWWGEAPAQLVLS